MLLRLLLEVCWDGGHGLHLVKLGVRHGWIQMLSHCESALLLQERLALRLHLRLDFCLLQLLVLVL